MRSTMLSTLVINAAMHTILVAAAPVLIAEPSIVTKVAVSTGMPFGMPLATVSPVLQARQAQSSSASPIVATPLPSAPMAPSSPYQPMREETHTQNVQTSKIIGIVLAGLVALALVLALTGTLFFRLHRNRVKNKGPAANAMEMGEASNSRPPASRNSPTPPRVYGEGHMVLVPPRNVHGKDNGPVGTDTVMGEASSLPPPPPSAISKSRMVAYPQRNVQYSQARQFLDLGPQTDANRRFREILEQRESRNL